jgi:hypothetical protein
MGYLPLLPAQLGSSFVRDMPRNVGNSAGSIWSRDDCGTRGEILRGAGPSRTDTRRLQSASASFLHPDFARIWMSVLTEQR